MTTSNLLPGANYANVTPCALVLEDSPTGDGRLSFESWPGEIEEAYSLAGYREIAGDRMPQPGFVAYRGGNWNTFSLELTFRAENQLNREISLGQMGVNDLSGLLVQMERKARWCEALGFPMERLATTFTERIRQNASSAGFSQEDLTSVGLSQLKRNDPPMFLVVLGSWFTIRCYLTNFSLKWTGPWHPLTAQPYGCVVTLSCQRLDQEYPDWESIRNSAGSRPQSPVLATIPGNVQLLLAVNRTLGDNIASQNALAIADARGGTFGGSAAATINAPGQF